MLIPSVTIAHGTTLIPLLVVNMTLKNSYLMMLAAPAVVARNSKTLLQEKVTLMSHSGMNSLSMRKSVPGQSLPHMIQIG